MKLYMAVTADRLEMPICVEEEATEIAKKLGISANSVYNAVSSNRPGTRCGYKLLRVTVED